LSGYELRQATEADIAYMDGLYRSKQTGNIILRSFEYWKEQINMFNTLGGRVYILLKNGENAGYGFVTDGFVQEGCGDVNRLSVMAGVKSYVTFDGAMNTPIGMAYFYDKECIDNTYMNLMYN
jgi:hypothetical protein